MSKINAEEAVTQEALDAATQPQEPQWEVQSFDGNTEPRIENPEPVAAEEGVIQEEYNETININEDGVAELAEDAPAPQEQEEVQPQGEAQVDEESVVEVEAVEIPEEVQPTEVQSDLPEWLEKLKNFHEDTGGGIDEYLRYTKDIDSLNDFDVLKEYYKNTKPNYTEEDIDLIIKTKFGTKEYGEGQTMSDEDRLKVLAMKDELVDAKAFLGDIKEQYYAELKSGVQAAPEEYKEAVEFQENFKKQTEQQEVARNHFIEASKQVFNDDFQGFQFNAGGKDYNIKVGNGQSVMESQLDLNDVIGQFLNEEGQVVDPAGWHKALWAAQNSDKLFNAGVEAGKAQALKERAQATKNPSYVNKGPSQPPKPKQQFRFIDNQNHFGN